jgi:hypothetical protein
MAYCSKQYLRSGIFHMSDSVNDSNKKDTADALGALGAVGGAVGTSHLLYRPGKMEEKLDAARERITDAKEALSAKVAVVPEGEMPTPKQAARNADLMHAQSQYAQAEEGYKSALKSIDPANPGTGKEIKNALKGPYKNLQRAGDRLVAAEDNAYHGLFGGTRSEIKTELNELRAARKALYKDLTKIESANAKTGIYAALKRPATILRHGDGKAALAIVAGAAALGGIVYVGTRVAQELSQQHVPSFQEREQMRNPVGGPAIG